MSIVKSLHWSLIAPIFFLCGASLLILSSIDERFFLYQMLWIGLGFMIFVLFRFVNWKPFINYAWFVWGIYVSSMSLLLLTFLFAPSIRHIRAWLVIGPFQIQTSEFVMAGLILMYAHFFSRHHFLIGRTRTVIFSFLLVALPIGFVLLQPDLGSAVVMAGLWFGLLLLSGLRMKHLLVAAIAFALLSVIAWGSFLEDYQKKRIEGLFNPESDPLGINYNVIQAKIAIGSAGFWGKGYNQGTQTQLGFLPESSADFVLAAFIEEWGILGVTLIFLAFVYLMFSILKIGVLADSNFEKYICLGTATMLCLHFVINAGSAIGLLPVVGVPFPFLSYGGSNLLTNFFLVGMVHSIAGKRG